MPRYYIKPDREVDYYVVWSTVVDSAVGYGTRAELLDEVRTEYGNRGVRHAEEALADADRDGSSAVQFLGGGWEDERLLVMEGGGPGYLRRADLRKYCDQLRSGDTAAAHALVVADDEEDE